MPDEVDIKKVMSAVLAQGGAAARTKSQAMSPLIAITAIVIPSAFVALAFSTNPVVHTVAGLCIVLMLIFDLLAYTYWALMDPDRLGSDQFVAHQTVIAAFEGSRDPTLLLGDSLIVGPGPASPPAEKLYVIEADQQDESNHQDDESESP